MDVYKINVCLIGDTYTGKSTFLNFIVNNYFKKIYETTIGVDFGSEIFKLNTFNIKWHIWDTTGSSDFLTVTKSYFRNMSLYFLFIDLNDPSSTKNLEMWMDRISLDKTKNTKIVLVGCKVDLDIKINEDYIEYFCDKYDLEYFKISIKDNLGVDTMIDKINNHFRKIIIQENESENLKEYGIILTEYSKTYKKNYMKLNDEPTVKNTCFSSCLIS